MNLELRPADGRDVEFAWSLFGAFARQHMFSGGNGRREPKDWNELHEKRKFQTYWAESNKYTITVDNTVVGWAAIVKDNQKVTIENWHVVEEWQNRDLATIILGDLVPRWRHDGLQVEASVLRHAPMTSAAEKLLANLGFEAGPIENHAMLMKIN